MAGEPGSDAFLYDFFISRRGSAKEAALEVAQVLHDAGYTSIVQDNDFQPGSNFVAEMHRALKECRHFFGLLTEDFDAAAFTEPEWTNFFALARMSKGKRRFALVRIDDFEPPGLFAAHIFGDLVGVTDPARRREIILSAAEGRLPPPRPAAATKILHGVPVRNPGFVGRAKMLDAVHSALTSSKRAAAITQAAIYGLGGIGKTSLAAEYVHQHADQYAGVWWVSAESRTLLIESLAELGAALDPQRSSIYEKRELSGAAEIMAKVALSKISESGAPWLLVYDNVKDPDDIRDLVPSGGARILITTRWTNWYGRAHPIEVDVLKEKEAANLLLKITGSNDRDGATRLADTLGCLPLALDHAGAYIRLTGLSFDQYAQRALDLISKAPKGVNYPNSVAATFGLAIEQAVRECAAAKDLLAFFSVLAPDQIPLDLADETIVSADAHNDALIALRGVSLIQYEPYDDGGQSIFLHRLVRAAMRAHLNAAGETTNVLTKAIARVANAFPDKGYSEPSCWPRCAKLLPHALGLRDDAKKANIRNEDVAHMLDGAANYFLGRGSFKDAEPLFKETVEIGKEALGPEHRRVGLWENNLGNLFLNSGRYDDAIVHYRRAISIGIVTIGRNTTNVATRINNLAKAFGRLGRYDEALAHFKEAIDTTEKALGRRDPIVAARLESLANLYRDMKRFDEAEPLYREAISIGEEKLGRYHPRVCDWINNMANMLRDRGSLAEAESLYRETIASLTGSVGAEHMVVGFARQDYAELLMAAGRLDEAKEQAELGLSILSNSFGADHKWALGGADTLRQVMKALGKPEAVDPIRQAS